MKLKLLSLKSFIVSQTGKQNEDKMGKREYDRRFIIL